MAAEIKIRWDGDVPGLDQHRLSLAAFADPLNQLLLALRRIATQIVSLAVEHERPKTGRFANLARQLDIEITSIEGNSTGFNGVVAFYQPPEELPLFADLPDRAVTELLDSIERESRGQATNWAVRKYLTSLPRAVHRQVYELHENGTTKKRVEIGDINLTEVPGEFPSLRELDGSVVGVGFEPGKSEVRMKSESATATFDATDEQVERALEVRKEDVRSLGVYDGKRTRLLHIAKASEPRFQVTEEAVEEHIFGRWSGVFARLAK